MPPIRYIAKNRLADGLVFARTEPKDARIRFLLDAGFPFVTHDRTNVGHHSWLDYDNASFARMAVERLVSKGRRHLILIPPSPQYTFAEHMVSGFRDAAEADRVTHEMPNDCDLNAPADAISD